MRTGQVLLLSLLLGIATLASAEITPSGQAAAPATAVPAPATQATDASASSNADATSAAPGTTPVVAAPYAAELRRNVQDVFQGPDFHQEESSTAPALRPWLKKWLDSFNFSPKKAEPKPGMQPDFLLLARIFKVIVIVLLAIGLVWLLWRGYRWLSPRLGTAPVRKPQGAITAAEISQLAATNALPDAISEASRRAWQQGRHSEALSLLYRGAVQALVQTRQLEMPVSATEGECLRLVRRHAPAATASAFAPIVQAWAALAYADRVPADFDGLLRLYRQHFESTGSAP